MEEQKTLYLIDGSAYIHRAYHAIRGLSNSKGLPTNAVFGFTRMLIKLIDDRSPTFGAMFFDAKGPTFRHEMYREYKANRPQMPEDLALQIPIIKDVTRGFNLTVIEQQGYEADDLIGTVARLAEAAGFAVVMVTGDKDFVQLVTPKTTIWDPMKDDIIDSVAVHERFGLNPDQMTDVMGLCGDKSDNVPGVPGIGLKTALELIKTYGDMEALYENVERITKKKQKENLIQYKEQAFLSQGSDQNRYGCTGDIQRRVTTVWWRPMQQKLSRAVSKISSSASSRRLSVRPANPAKRITGPSWRRPHLLKLAEVLKEADLAALDTETTSTDPMQADLVGLSVAVRSDQAYYIPVGHTASDASGQLDREEVLQTCSSRSLSLRKSKKSARTSSTIGLCSARAGSHSMVWYSTRCWPHT